MTETGRIIAMFCAVAAALLIGGVAPVVLNTASPENTVKEAKSFICPMYQMYKRVIIIPSDPRHHRREFATYIPKKGPVPCDPVPGP